MFTYLSRVKAIFSVSTMLLIPCGAIFAITLWSWNTKPRIQKAVDISPVMQNRTKAFQLVDTKKSADALTLVFRNDSSKTITAYTLSLDDDATRLGADYVASGEGINPGATVDIDIPFSQFLPAQSVGSQQNRVTVLTVVFEDSSSEGDVGSANYILETRRGERIQMKKIRKLIQIAIGRENKNESLTLPELRQRISSLPETVEGQFPMNYGMHYAKERVIKQIASVEKEHIENQFMKVVASDNLREKLGELLYKTDIMIAKYDAALAK